MPEHTWFLVTLREWLEHQEHENVPHRAELSAAIHHGDVDRVRGLLRDAPFSAPQRRYLDDLLARWEQATTPSPEGDAQ